MPGPQSEAFDLLTILGGWQPIASLAQDTGKSFEVVSRSVYRWQAQGHVEIRRVELSRSLKQRGGVESRIEVRVTR